jgi:hypothetical protein
MVPKVAGKGRSFKGAGQYYLHDKNADSADRVAFTHTLNLPTDDPELALRHMAYTAMHQDRIKAQAGVKATGRKSAQSVYTYSLSWAPDEAPTREEMIAAGQESLQELGLEGHEVLMVAHDDEPHPHLHLIVNRVHSQTGVMARLNKDFLTLSRWAEGYERRQGHIRCEERVENNEARRKGQFVKYRGGMSAADFHRWRKQQGAQAFFVRQAEARNLSAYHRGQRRALYDERRHRAEQRRQEIRAVNRPKWAELYRRQREEWKALNAAQGTAYSRLRYHLEQRGHDKRTGTKTGFREVMADALRAVFGRDNPHGALSRKHEAERKALATEIRQQTRAAVRNLERGYQKELGRLETAPAQETRTLAERHSKASQERARAIKEGRDEAQFRKESEQGSRQTLSNEFERRAWERIREARQRREDEKKRGKDRDPGRERE